MGEIAIVYDSKTGNVERFIGKFPEGLEIYKVGQIEKMNKPFIFITYTTGFGLIPESSRQFLENNDSYLRGVASSGSRNWGDNYAAAASKISNLFNCPVITRFELGGTKRVVQDILKFMQAI